MINIAIIEDDPGCADRLRQYIERFQEQEQIPVQMKYFKNGIIFLNTTSSEFDIVFMDIDMPYMNGLDTARKYRQLNTCSVLIFITNLAQYAIDGYEVSAMDYMLKPVQYEALSVRLKRAVEIAEKRRSRTVALKVKAGVKLIDISDIYYIEVMKHRLVYHTVYGDEDVWRALSQVEEELKDAGFARCNSCYLVNLKHVTAIQNEEIVVHGEKLKVSRTRKKEFINALMEYMQGMGS